MLMIFAQSTLTGILVGLAMVFMVAIGYWSASRTQAPLGARSSAEPSSEEISSPRKPSIERSEKNSTASITVQANPARPVVYTQELVNGSRRLVKLTVLYEQSLDDSELATLQFVDSASKREPVEYTDPEDPAWLDKVKEANKQWT